MAHPASYTAWAFNEKFGDLIKVTVPWTDPKQGQIVVKVRACCVAAGYVPILYTQRRASLTTITHRVAAVAETHAHLRTRLSTRHLSVGGGRCLMSCPLRKGARRIASSPPSRMIDGINRGSCSHTVCLYNVLHPSRGIRRWSSITLSPLSVFANGSAHVRGSEVRSMGSYSRSRPHLTI